jgi:hypothetical protein
MQVTPAEKELTMRVGLQTQGVRSLDVLEQKIDAQDIAKKDYKVNTNNLTVTNSDQLLIDGVGFFTITPHMSRQIATFLGIPYAYYRKMQIDAPELLQKSAQTWLQKNDKDRFIRTLGTKARAFVSDRYRPLDNGELYKAIHPIILAKNVDVVSSEITDTRFYIKMVDPKLKGKVNWGTGNEMGRAKNDEILWGITISNSEVGAGSLQVKSMTLSSWCSNLMIVGKEFSRYHVGKTVESDNNKVVYKDETRRADDNATFLKLRDTVDHALTEASMLETLKKYDEAVTKDFKDPIKTVEKLSKHLGASENEKGSILESLIKGEAYNQWSLANAVTATAEKVISYDRSTEMETMGMEVIDLSPSQWNEIAV